MLKYFNVMDLLENVYIETTNHDAKFTRLLSLDVAFSILLHSAIYTGVVYVAKERKNLHPGKNKFDIKFYQKLFIALVIIMAVGYFIRLWRVKAIHNTIKANRTTYGWATNNLTGLTESETRRITDDAYKVWYFLG